MMRNVALTVGLVLVAAGWSEPAAAQLRYTVHSIEKCEPISHEIARRVLYYKKLRVQQDHWSVRDRRVSPTADSTLAELDRWAPGEQRRLASMCRSSRPTRDRPWLYEWAEPRR